MHTVSLDKYVDVRNVVVSYLQAKRVWLPQATYAGSSAKRDPNAMDIGKVAKSMTRKGTRAKTRAKLMGKESQKVVTKAKVARMARGRTTKTKTSPSVPSVGATPTPLTSVGTTPRAKAKAEIRASISSSVM